MEIESASYTSLLSFWILQAIALSITAFLLPGLRVTGFFGPLLTVIALSLVNASLWDAALFFSVPDSLSVHAALVLGANAVVFWILVKILPGIEISGIVPALLAPVIFTVLSVLLSSFAKDVDWIAIVQSFFSSVEEGKELLKQGAGTR